jgi:hypothetical protein
MRLSIGRATKYVSVFYLLSSVNVSVQVPTHFRNSFITSRECSACASGSNQIDLETMNDFMDDFVYVYLHSLKLSNLRRI